MMAFATDQHGAVSVAQLARAGVDRRAIERIARHGVIERAGRGVYVVSGSPDTWERNLWIGSLVLGPDALVSHEAAVLQHHLDRSIPGSVEFSVDRERRGVACPFRVHTSAHLAPIDRVVIGGLPTTSATRTIIDLARARVPRVRLEASIDSAVRSGASAPAVLAVRLDELRGRGRWGCRLLDELLVDSGGHTLLERRFLQIVRRHGLPRPRTQAVLRSGSGRIGRVDFHFEEHGVVVEVSGGLGHSTPAERARDAQRRNELQDIGRLVYEYTWDDVTRRELMVAATLRARLRAAGWRP